MSPPLVSIIVPIYKVSLKFLQECLNSLSKQTMQECEFILVSDGAPNAEESLCEEYVQKDNRFKFFKCEHNGVSTTRNYGLRQAQGEFITFVDSDDIIQYNAIEIFYTQAKKNNSDILVTNYADISKINTNHEHLLWKSSFVTKIEKEEIKSILEEFIRLRPNSIPRGPVGKLYSRKFLETNTILFNKKLKIGEDLVFNFMCFSKASNISYCPEILYFYRANEESVTRAFNYNFFYDRLAPVLEIEKNFPGIYNDLIGREIVDVFFQSWPHCYMNPSNNESIYNRMKKVRQIINSNIFQKAIATSNTKNMNLLVRLELLLFKNKITFPIWFHAIKALIIKPRI